MPNLYNQTKFKYLTFLYSRIPDIRKPETYENRTFLTSGFRIPTVGVYGNPKLGHLRHQRLSAIWIVEPEPGNEATV